MKMNCPHCRKEYEVDSTFEFWHQEVTCAECGKDFVAMTDQERAFEEKKRKERSAATFRKVRNVVIGVIAAVVLINGVIIGIGFFENRTVVASDAPAGDSAGENSSSGGDGSLLLAPDDVDYENFTPTTDEQLLKRAAEDLEKLWQDTDVYRLGKNIKNKPDEAAKGHWEEAENARREAKEKYGVRIEGYTWHYTSNAYEVRQLLRRCDNSSLLGNIAYARALEEVRNTRRETVNKFVNRYNEIMRSISCPMLKRSIVNDIYTLVINDESDAASVLENLIKFNTKLEDNKNNLPELCRLMGRDFFTIEEKEALVKKWFGADWRKTMEKNKKDEYFVTEVHYKELIKRLSAARENLLEEIFKKHKDNFSDPSYAALFQKQKKGNAGAVKDYKRFLVMVERADDKVTVDYFDSTYNSALSTIKRYLSKFSIEPEFQPVDSERKDERQLSFAEIKTEIERLQGLIDELLKRKIPNLSVMRGVVLFPDRTDDSAGDSGEKSDAPASGDQPEQE